VRVSRAIGQNLGLIDANGMMQKYHAVAEIICNGVFATDLGFCPL
jgi:hypothetical protein